MGYQKGSDGTPPYTSRPDGKIVSLQAHRRRRDIRIAREELVPLLKSTHRRAIDVHNRIIDCAEVSVLTELCRSVGLFLDLIDDSLQCAVVTPAALYGDSGGRIFGKKPLQDRIARALDEPERRQLFEALNQTCPVVWEHLPESEDSPELIRPLAGPGRRQFEPIAGVIGRAGKIVDAPGIYSGWKIEFRDHEFVVFGHCLDGRRAQAICEFLSTRDDLGCTEFWRRAQFDVLQVIIDPDDRHCFADPNRPRRGIRRPASRNALLLAIRRAIWRHFAEPAEGLTLHAHLAALADDPEGFGALVDEMRAIVETTTIRLGGLREGADPIALDEILAPFHVDARGRLPFRDDLRAHPASVLLVDPDVADTLGLQEGDSIGRALERAGDHPDTAEARALELAWMTYRSEQNLMAIYGMAPKGACAEASDVDPPAFAKHSAVFPNLRTLFDPRFLQCSFEDLELSQRHRRALAEALGLDETALSALTFADAGHRSEKLTRLPGLPAKTRRAFREAILELAARWRWKRCGLV